jgi:hypothetical protein
MTGLSKGAVSEGRLTGGVRRSLRRRRRSPHPRATAREPPTGLDDRRDRGAYGARDLPVRSIGVAFDLELEQRPGPQPRPRLPRRPGGGGSDARLCGEAQPASQAICAPVLLGPAGRQPLPLAAGQPPCGDAAAGAAPARRRALARSGRVRERARGTWIGAGRHLRANPVFAAGCRVYSVGLPETALQSQFYVHNRSTRRTPRDRRDRDPGHPCDATCPRRKEEQWRSTRAESVSWPRA